jgi:hypothetical protein
MMRWLGGWAAGRASRQREVGDACSLLCSDAEGMHWFQTWQLQYAAILSLSR